MLAVVVAAQVLGDEALREVAAAQVGGLLAQVHLAQHGGRGHGPAHAHARREDLAEGGQVHHPAGATVEFEQRGKRVALEADHPVRVVLDDEQAVGVGELDEALPAGQRHGDARGILEVGDGVEQLGRAALVGQARVGLFQQVNAHAVVVEGHVGHVCAVGGEARHRARVGGALGQHGVAGVHEGPDAQVNGLLAARGDEDVVNACVRTLVGHEDGDLLAQILHAVGGAVLQARCQVLGTHVGHDVVEDGAREGLGVGQPTGQRDDIGLLGDGHEIAHGRRHGPGGQRREARVVARCVSGADKRRLGFHRHVVCVHHMEPERPWVMIRREPCRTCQTGPPDRGARHPPVPDTGGCLAPLVTSPEHFMAGHGGSKCRARASSQHGQRRHRGPRWGEQYESSTQMRRTT